MSDNVRHLRYSATDRKWEFHLKLTGFSEEQIAYVTVTIHREMALMSLLFPELLEIPKEFVEE